MKSLFLIVQYSDNNNIADNSKSYPREYNIKSYGCDNCQGGGCANCTPRF